MTKLKLSDVKNILDEDLAYSTIVDYLRFLGTFGRGTKVTCFDEDLIATLRVETANNASQKMSNLYLNDLVRREQVKNIKHGRKPFVYYVPK